MPSSNATDSNEQPSLVASIHRMCLMFGFILGMLVHFADLMPTFALIKIAERVNYDLTKMQPWYLELKVTCSVVAACVGASSVLLFSNLMRAMYQHSLGVSTSEGKAVLERMTSVIDCYFNLGVMAGFSVAGFFTFWTFDLPLEQAVFSGSFLLILAVCAARGIAVSSQQDQEEGGEEVEIDDEIYVRLI